jgi:hypothetical protein
VDEARITAPAIPVAPGMDPSGYEPAFRTFALRELSADDLFKLCNDFTDAVFKAAGKQQPPTKG